MTLSIDCVLVYSGGMDSTVLLYDILSQGRRPAALSFDYGSRHNARELPFAAATCQALGVPHEIVSLAFMEKLFSSALLKNGPDIPDGRYETENMALTAVPFRNPILMSISVGYAESIGASEVLLASHGGDHHLYPDCRQDFNQAFDRAVRLGTDSKVRLSFPYGCLDKKEIADIGRGLGVDFSQTWTCYKGEEIHCGTCAACLERMEALGHKEGQDPTQYQKEGR